MLNEGFGNAAWRRCCGGAGHGLGASAAAARENKDWGGEEIYTRWVWC
jgi:hypothetical protein